MAQNVYSLRIFATGELDPAVGIVGPLVPDGLVYVLRDIDVTEISGTAAAAMQVLNQVGGVLWVYQRSTSLDSAYAAWRGRQVYNPGERVGFEAVTGSWAIAASGYQLTLP